MFAWALKKLLGTSNERELKKLQPLVEEINKYDARFAKLSDAELQAKTPEFRQKLENGASLDDLLPEAFAVCREGAKRVLRMRHYDVQLIGGMTLHRGNIAEMRTGEGKTLVATLPSYLNALDGKGVHVVTVNDYLARRDAEVMGKLYGFLGLKTGVVVNSQDEGDKRGAYQADITYGQNNEFGFDYLRDNMKRSALEYVQRPLNFAIIDEDNSTLLDEARTQLIISGQQQESSDKYRIITEIIPKLKKDEHYVVDEKGHSVSLTEDGIDAAQRLLGFANLFDPVNLESLHILNQCLKANTLFVRDVNYLVTAEGKVMIVDEFTGRALPGRRWSDGLHQAVEAKEGVRIQEESRTVATITFQNLFRLYKKLGGMTGTAETEAAEFHSTYNLNVVVIPTNKPIQRKDVEDVVYKTEREKFDAVAKEILEDHERGQPVLVGTTNVQKSEVVASILRRRKIPYAVLNAKQHEKEAFVVAQAGRKGAITVSTNMAGRGTDIILGGNAEMLAKLEFKEQNRDPDAEPEAFQETVEKYEGSCKEEGEEVRELGGLHIVGTERHDSRRIDNQLRGRAGRQGDPGSSRFFLSLEDDLMRIFGGDRVKVLMERMGLPDDEPIEHPWVTKSIVDAQGKVEARNFDMRKNVLEYDDVMNQQRKTVYDIRQSLLAGTYAPEILDDEGKPTGRRRDIKELPHLRDQVKDTVAQMVLAFCTSKETRTGNDAATFRGAPRPSKLDDAATVESLESVQREIYEFYGFKTTYKESEADDPKGLHERLVAEIAQSLTEQRERALDIMDGCIGAIIEECCPRNKPFEDWDWKGLRQGFIEHFGIKPTGNYSEIGDLFDLAHELYKQAEVAFLDREKEAGTELFLRVFRHYYVTEIDQQWVEHLTNMEHLRDGIGLRGYGQRDPKQEYKKEGYDLFVTMMASVTSSAVTQLFSVKFRREDDIAAAEREALEAARVRQQELHLLAGGEEYEGDDVARSLRPPAPEPIPEPEKPAVQRNEVCPCGSGELFKKCHGEFLDDDDASV